MFLVSVPAVRDRVTCGELVAACPEPAEGLISDSRNTPATKEMQRKNNTLDGDINSDKSKAINFL